MTLTHSELRAADGDAPATVIVEVDGVPVSALLAEAPSARAVLIALHGGSTTSAYFDCPGHPELSLVRLAVRLGYTVLAVDRPGYGASAPHAEQLVPAPVRVQLMFDAIAAFLRDRPRGAGVVLTAHSAGAELAMRMAGDPRFADLLGVELAGTGCRYHPEGAGILRTVGPDSPRPPGVGDLIWNPASLYPPDARRGAAIAVPAPPAETTAVVDWPSRVFPELAAGIGVPVRFTVGDHERVWSNDVAALAEVGAMFTAAPRVVLNIQPNSAHNISVGNTATAYHLGLLAFAEECLVAAEHGGFSGPTPQLDGGTVPPRR
ncbi:alpha/beta fold hydrolase [Nocardia sp. NPDC050378]|uniref:alpha/beta hydrolase n=1 Tax=Nocardia sp. NPDC050378 TaxID=3155400 RepID=UPI0033CA52BB